MKTTRFALHQVMIVVVSFLALASLACSAIVRATPATSIASTPTLSPPEVEVLASDLGKVYGVAFDREGNLFATGTKEDKSVLWKIGQDGTKEVFAEITDQGDVLSEAGLASHSRHLANVAVDGEGNIWITSLKHGACFVVSRDGGVSKIYLNSLMSISFQEDVDYPEGVAWDDDGNQLYIITSGPTSTYSTENVHHIRTLTIGAFGENPAQEIDEIKDSGGYSAKVIKNDGIPIQEGGNGLLKAKNSPLYFLGQHALYEVPADGELRMFGEGLKDMTLWGAAIDDGGEIYLSANARDYNLEDGSNADGVIFKMDREGKRTVFLRDVAEPLGMVFQNGYLYVADRSTGSILRVKGGSGAPDSMAETAKTAGSTPAPTQPASIPPTSGSSSAAKTGHWEGKPSVSFNVTSDGNIRDFKIEAPVALSKCKIELEGMDVEGDGTFIYTALIKDDDYWPGMDRSGKPWPTPVMTETGPMVEAVRISGRFDSPTTLTGSFRILACGNQQYFWAEGKGTETWSAEWKGPEEIAEALVASPTPIAQPPTWTPVPPTSTPAPISVSATPAVPPTVEAPASPLSGGYWQRVLDLPRTINTLVVDPADPRVLYAGTGDYASSGSGVYKSEDAGLTWRSVSAGLPNQEVLALTFSHDGSPTLYAAIGSEIFASADGAESWTRLGDTDFFGVRECLLRGDPGDRNVLFAVAKSDGVARSSDGGYTWLPVGEGLPGDEHSTYAMSLAIDPTNSNVLYLGTGGFVGGGHGVYKSTDGGESWLPANRGMLDYRITALTVDPAQPQTVYAGGYAGDLFKSADGGQTWTDLTDRLPLRLSDHPTIRDIVVDPATPETVYLLADRGGMLVTNDGGSSWRLLGKPGEPDHLSFTAMTIIFGSQPEPVLVVGVEDAGGWRYDVARPAPAPTATLSPVSALPPLPPGRWESVLDLPRQINTLVVDPSNPQVFYAGTGDSGSGSGVYKSEDAGLTWRLVASGLPDEDVTALAISPGAPSILYAAVGVRGDVYASTDGAESWTRLGDSGTMGGFYRQLYVDPGGGASLFMVARPGGVARSLDGGYTWLPVGEGLPGDEREVYVLSLAIDPTDSSIVYAGTGAWVGGGHGVYKSTDGGETWSPANRAMLDYRITAMAIDPTQPQTVYAGGDYGELFKSTDGGQTWTDISDTLRIQEYSYPRTIRDIIVNPAAPETVFLLGDNAGVMISYDGGMRWRALAKPGEDDQPVFTVMATVFDPQPVLIVGIERKGGWRYASSQPSPAPAASVATASPAALPTVLPTETPTAVSRKGDVLTQATSTPTRAVSQPSPTPAPPPANCPDPRATITFPVNGATIQGVVPFVGTASLDGLNYYKFEYKPADSATWQFLTQFDGKSVTSDKLMDFHTSTIAPGVYDFRLIVVDRTGNYLPPCEIRVTVQR